MKLEKNPINTYLITFTLEEECFGFPKAPEIVHLEGLSFEGDLIMTDVRHCHAMTLTQMLDSINEDQSAYDKFIKYIKRTGKIELNSFQAVYEHNSEIVKEIAFPIKTVVAFWQYMFNPRLRTKELSKLYKASHHFYGFQNFEEYSKTRWTKEKHDIQRNIDQIVQEAQLALASLWYDMAIVNTYDKKFEDAIASCNQALEFNPDCLEAIDLKEKLLNQ